MRAVCVWLLGVLSCFSACLYAKTVHVPPRNPQQAVLQAFLYCDAQWLMALTQQAEYLPEIKPVAIKGAGGISYIPVPNRRQFNVDGQTRTFSPSFKVGDIPFNEFIDEILAFSLDASTQEAEASTQTVADAGNASMFEYYWGFNTDAKVNQVLPMIQRLLPQQQQLTANKTRDTWMRVEEFKHNQWTAIPKHHAGRDVAAQYPQRALIVQEHEGGGTRVLCGLQAAPLPEAELKRLRPDLSVP